MGRDAVRAMADELRGRIAAGRPGPGGRLPSQAALAAEFGVERGAVRQVLALLRAEGLLLDAARGSRAVVAARPGARPGAGAPLPTAVALTPRVAAAFEAPRVSVDALCRTAATLTLAVGEALRLIHAGRLRPESVEVRVLLPSRNIDLAFPSPVSPDDSGAGVLHSGWLAQRNAQGQVLRHNLRALRATHGIDADVTFRALPFTPPVKLYLLNGAEALFAYYTLGRRDRDTGDGSLETWDALGEQSPLFPFATDGVRRDAAFVEQSRLWFDALWNTISTDLVLG